MKPLDRPATGQRPRRHLAARLGAVLVAAAASGVLAARAGAEADPAAADTTGTAQLEWAYDRWTVPWVQIAGPTQVFAPGSHATLMVLACEVASLERDRLTRHLSAEECEHRMVAVRAEQDTALAFRLNLLVYDFRGANELARLAPSVTLRLEDDRGRRWQPIEVRPGPAVNITSGQKLKRLTYHPPWLRDIQDPHPLQYGVTEGRSVTVAEHRVRFPRRDPRTGERLISRDTRWLRLRLSYPSHELVATWPFQPGAGL